MALSAPLRTSRHLARDELVLFRPRQIKLACAQLDGVIGSLGEACRPMKLRARRNKALLLLSFWCAWGADRLASLAAEDITHLPELGLLCRWPSGRNGEVLYRFVPARRYLCPVRATMEWLQVSPCPEGSVFRGIDRWGNLSSAPLHASSLVRVLEGVIYRTGFTN